MGEYFCRREAVQNRLDAEALISELYLSQFAAEHKLDSFSKFALFKAFGVGNMEVFVQDHIFINTVNAVNGWKWVFGKVGVFFALGNIGAKIEVILRKHNADRLDQA